MGIIANDNYTELHASIGPAVMADMPTNPAFPNHQHYLEKPLQAKLRSKKAALGVLGFVCMSLHSMGTVLSIAKGHLLLWKLFLATGLVEHDPTQTVMALRNSHKHIQELPVYSSRTSLSGQACT